MTRTQERWFIALGWLFIALCFATLIWATKSKAETPPNPIAPRPYPQLGDVWSTPDGDTYTLVQIDPAPTLEPRDAVYTYRAGVCGMQTLTIRGGMAQALTHRIPEFDEQANAAEVQAFLAGTGPPPCWQWNGKSWTFTAGKHITADYWRMLMKSYSLTAKK